MALLGQVLQAFEASSCNLGDLVTIQVELGERAGQTWQHMGQGLPHRTNKVMATTMQALSLHDRMKLTITLIVVAICIVRFQYKCAD